MKGICHVGAYDGNEISTYYNEGYDLAIWVEPNYFVFSRLVENTSKFDIKNIWLPLLLSDVDDELVDFFLTNNEESSSFMTIGEKLYEIYPEICIVSKIKLLTKRFDTYILSQKDFDWDDIKKLIIDCQGSDLKVLKGFGKLLESTNLKEIQVEVNFVELYIGTPSENEIDTFLQSYGFWKHRWFIVKNKSWGNITWIRE